MMTSLRFFKYQGTGNDFVMIDNRTGVASHLSQENIEKICHRRWGIGADGLILIENEDNYDFRMVYYNSDGRESSMCGNGGRCAVAFAHLLGMFDKKCKFIAIDGAHKASIIEEIVALEMNVEGTLQKMEQGYFINTGSPHLVITCNGLAAIDVKLEGSKHRNHSDFAPGGTNVNFLEIEGEKISMRTYERGVEDETLSCGTGVVAASLVAAQLLNNGSHTLQMNTPGGTLQVSFEKEAKGYKNVVLTGPATYVFDGNYLLH